MTEGLLCFFKRSLDIGLVDAQYRDRQLSGLVDIMLRASEENQVVLGSGMASCQYSFGALERLLYSDWNDFENNPALKGIGFNTYLRLIDCFTINPSPKEISNQAYKAYLNRKGYIGLAKFGIPAILQPYTYDYQSYNNWQADWYRMNPSEITWSADSPFLPNLEYVETVLEEELVRAGKYDYTVGDAQESRVHKLAIAFHEKVMRMKGEQTKPYTLEIGGKICLGNAYTFEKQLSENERKACGAPRSIYSIEKEGVKQYISLDLAHGMFEFHDNKGVHLGEFHFDGSPNKSANSIGKHDFKTIP